jgi:hypothetical protein
MFCVMGVCGLWPVPCGHLSWFHNWPQGQGECFINTFQIFYPNMFRHMVAILRGSWVPDKLLKKCPVLWACADYDPSRVATCLDSTTTGHTDRVNVLLIRSKFSTPTCFCIWLPSSEDRECLISYSSNVLCYGRVRIMTRPVWPVVGPRPRATRVGS